jgi:hypothetical protein
MAQGVSRDHLLTRIRAGERAFSGESSYGGGRAYWDFEAKRYRVANLPFELGGKLHYNQEGPKLLSELTGSKAQRVNFGTHQNVHQGRTVVADWVPPSQLEGTLESLRAAMPNATFTHQPQPAGGVMGEYFMIFQEAGQRENLVMRNTEGKLKDDVTARMWDLEFVKASKKEQPWTMFGKDRPWTLPGAMELGRGPVDIRSYRDHGGDPISFVGGRYWVDPSGSLSAVDMHEDGAVKMLGLKGRDWNHPQKYTHLLEGQGWARIHLFGDTIFAYTTRLTESQRRQLIQKGKDYGRRVVMETPDGSDRVLYEPPPHHPGAFHLPPKPPGGFGEQRSEKSIVPKGFLAMIGKMETPKLQKSYQNLTKDRLAILNNKKLSDDERAKQLIRQASYMNAVFKELQRRIGGHQSFAAAFHPESGGGHYEGKPAERIPKVFPAMAAGEVKPPGIERERRTPITQLQEAGQRLARQLTPDQVEAAIEQLRYSEYQVAHLKSTDEFPFSNEDRANALRVMRNDMETLRAELERRGIQSFPAAFEAGGPPRRPGEEEEGYSFPGSWWGKKKETKAEREERLAREKETAPMPGFEGKPAEMEIAPKLKGEAPAPPPETAAERAAIGEKAFPKVTPEFIQQEGRKYFEESPRALEFRNFAEHFSGYGVQPHQLYDVFQDLFHGMMNQASGERLGQIVDELGLWNKILPRKQVQEGRRTRIERIPDAPEVEGPKLLQEYIESAKREKALTGEFGFAGLFGKQELEDIRKGRTQRAKLRGRIIDVITNKVMEGIAPREKSLRRTGFNIEDIWWDPPRGQGGAQYDPFHRFSSDEARNTPLVERIGTDFSRRSSRDNETITRRILVMVSRVSGKVTAASAYEHGRHGMMVARPGPTAGLKGSHVRWQEIGGGERTGYRAVYSILLKDPVQAFVKTFKNIRAFDNYINIEEAIRRNAISEFPQLAEMETAGGTEGSELGNIERTATVYRGAEPAGAPEGMRPEDVEARESTGPEVEQAEPVLEAGFEEMPKTVPGTKAKGGMPFTGPLHGAKGTIIEAKSAALPGGIHRRSQWEPMTSREALALFRMAYDWEVADPQDLSIMIKGIAAKARERSDIRHKRLQTGLTAPEANTLSAIDKVVADTWRWMWEFYNKEREEALASKTRVARIPRPTPERAYAEGLRQIFNLLNAATSVDNFATRMVGRYAGPAERAVPLSPQQTIARAEFERTAAARPRQEAVGVPVTQGYQFPRAAVGYRTPQRPGIPKPPLTGRLPVSARAELLGRTATMPVRVTEGAKPVEGYTPTTGEMPTPVAERRPSGKPAEYHPGLLGPWPLGDPRALPVISKGEAKFELMAKQLPDPPAGAFYTEVKDAFELEANKATRVLYAYMTRRGTEDLLAATRDAVNNTANNFSNQAENNLRLFSGARAPATRWEAFRGRVQHGDPHRLRAAIALIQAGFDRDRLGDFRNDVQTGRLNAQSLIATGGIWERHMGEKWLEYQQKLDDMLDYAEAHWDDPGLQNLAKAAKLELDRQYNREVNAGHNIIYDEDYVPGRYEAEFFSEPTIIFGPIHQVLGLNWKSHKTFDNYFQASKDEPYLAKTLDIASIVGHRVRQGMTRINQDAWFEMLKNFRDPYSGDPNDPATWKNIAANPIRRPDNTYSPVDVESVPVYYRHGKPPLSVRRAWEGLVVDLTNKSALTRSHLGRNAVHMAQWLKHTMLFGDIFHLGRMFYYGTALMGPKNAAHFGRYGLAAIDYRPEDLERAVQAGLVTKEAADWVKGTVIVNVGGGRTVSMTRYEIAQLGGQFGLNNGRIQDALYKELTEGMPGIYRYNRWLFDRVTRGLITESFVRNFERMNKMNPTVDSRYLGRDVAKDMNFFYGNIGRQGWFKSATWQDLNRLLFLAPQWVEGLAKKELAFLSRTVKAGVRGGQWMPRQMQQRYGLPTFGAAGRAMWIGLLMMAGITQAINLITRRKPTWENNEEGHMFDAFIPTGSEEGEGVWLSPLSVYNELSHDVVRMWGTKNMLWEVQLQIGENKLSPYGRIALVGVTRQTATGQRITSTMGIGREMARQAVPWPISGSRFLQYGLSQAGLMQKPQPGALPRQLFATAGFKVEPSRTPVEQIRTMSERFMQEHPEYRKDEGWIQVQTDEPNYTKLRAAVRNGDDAEARRQWEGLRVSRTYQQIVRAFQLQLRRPFTGAHRTESIFLDTLTPQQLDLYTKAQEQRYVDFDKFVDWLGKTNVE